MIIHLSYTCSFNSITNLHLENNSKWITPTKTGNLRSVTIRSQNQEHLKVLKKGNKDFVPFCSSRFCTCVTRRQLIEALASAPLPTDPSSMASDLPPNDPMAMLKKFHPPKPDWYEEFYAYVLKNFQKSYEAEIAGYKSKLFTNLRGKADTILEFGIGTGPNLKYYANEPGVHVFAVDPIMKMEKYACAAAASAGIPPTNFRFMQGVGEALPLGDASVDAVIGTLVLCSVKDINLALQEIMRVLKPGGFYLFIEHVAAEDGTIRRRVQGFLDPLQQFIADGCHLTRKTGELISKAGFSTVEIQQVSISAASIMSPHVYGIAYK